MMKETRHHRIHASPGKKQEQATTKQHSKRALTGTEIAKDREKRWDGREREGFIGVPCSMDRRGSAWIVVAAAEGGLDTAPGVVLGATSSWGCCTSTSTPWGPCTARTGRTTVRSASYPALRASPSSSWAILGRPYHPAVARSLAMVQPGRHLYPHPRPHQQLTWEVAENSSPRTVAGDTVDTRTAQSSGWSSSYSSTQHASMVDASPLVPDCCSLELEAVQVLWIQRLAWLPPSPLATQPSSMMMPLPCGPSSPTSMSNEAFVPRVNATPPELANEISFSLFLWSRRWSSWAFCFSSSRLSHSSRRSSSKRRRHYRSNS